MKFFTNLSVSLGLLAAASVVTASPLPEEDNGPALAPVVEVRDTAMLMKRANAATATLYASSPTSWAPSSTPQLWQGNAQQSYAIWFQTDGNLVVYTDPNNDVTAVWDTATGCSNESSCEMIFQSDGNLVIYDNGAALWNSGTGGGRGHVAYFVPDAAPYISIYDSSGNLLWEAVHPRTPPPGCPGSDAEGKVRTDIVCP